jgi:hypothetical protein
MSEFWFHVTDDAEERRYDYDLPGHSVRVTVMDDFEYTTTVWRRDVASRERIDPHQLVLARFRCCDAMSLLAALFGPSATSEVSACAQQNIDIVGSCKAAWCARGARSASPLRHTPRSSRRRTGVSGAALSASFEGEQNGTAPRWLWFTIAPSPAHHGVYRRLRVL